MYGARAHGFISRHGYQSVSALLFVHFVIFIVDGNSEFREACCLCFFRILCYNIKALPGAEMFSGLNY